MKKIKRNISTFLVFIFVFSLLQIQNVGTVVNATPTLITSIQYDIDEGINAITKIPFITQSNTFMENVNVAEGFTATLYQSNGTTQVTSGKVSTGMKLKIYQNGNLQKTYTLIVLAEIYPDELVVDGTNSTLQEDDSSTNVPMPFSFNYYGNNYNNVTISTNGFLQFSGNNASDYRNFALPRSTDPKNIICAFFDDIVPGSGLLNEQAAKPTILYTTIGASPNRKFIVQWTNMYFFHTDVQMGTFQAILYEGTDKIQIQYRELMGGSRSFGDSATIGIENSTGTLATQYSYSDVTHGISYEPPQGSMGTVDYKPIYTRQAISFSKNSSNYNMNLNDTYDPIYLLDANSPGMPTLISPSNGALGIKNPITFSWQGGSNTTSYQLLVATDSNFSDIGLNVKDITTTSYTDNTLHAGTTYYWKVLANNTNGTTTSNPRSLITGTLTSPTITTILDQFIAKNTSTGELEFTISDPDTNISDILMSASSSNETVVKKENIQITGLGTSATNRTIRITPENDSIGTTIITLNVFDGSDIATSNFILKVGNAPSISSINDVFVEKGNNTGSINFTISDIETPASNLIVSATSSNTSVVPINNIILGGSGSNRTILVTPISSLTSGSSTITVTVTNGEGFTSKESFVVTIADPISLTLSQTPTSITEQDVTINVNVTASSGIAVQKWLPGIKVVSDFASEGTTFTGDSFKVNKNGDYTIYIKDNSGNEVVKTITVNNIDKSGPEAPTNLVQDDEKNTFGWTNVPGYTKTSDYEYSLDGGVTWTIVTSNPQSIPNGNFEAGKIKVRVKANANGRDAGEALSSTEPYTAAPNNPVIGGVLDGMAYKYDVTPTFTGGTATLNGQPFNNGTVVSNEGEYTLIVIGENNTTSATVHFVIDKTPPVISGVTEGTEYKSSVTPTFNEGTATLNNKPYTSGTVISEEGNYTLIVTDAAGNTSVVDFTIRKTTATVSGVVDNMIYNVDVTPIFNEGTATLDGIPYTSGTTVSTEGAHILVVTDNSGNVATIHFTIDKTAPVISGVTEGTTYKTNVAPTFNEGTATLNGNPYTSGTVISSEGTYTLIATDAAGNTSTVHFEIRKSVGSITGVADGLVYNRAVVPTFEEGTATLEGNPYTSGTPISAEGTYTLVFTDDAENVSTIHFAIDKTAPVISGVEEAGVYKTSVTPTFNEGTATLNGQPYTSGSAISNEGSYTLTVVDEAGNTSTVHFIISNKTPVINGVVDDTAYNIDVIPTFEEGTVTLNGIPYISGTPISEEGLHVLQITDEVGNTTGSAITFRIDKTAPVINGVEDGESYNRDVTPGFNEGNATLNGIPYTSGTTISNEGSYILIVTDEAGNTSSVYFTIRKPSSEVTGVSDDTVYNKDVMPIFEEGTATLNGKPYISGTIISDEGSYELIVVSPPGNTTGSAITFEIDKTPPVISGVEDGESYKTDISPTFNEGIATLDGRPYTSGTPITSEGSHILIVTDAAGNTTVARFEIRKENASITGVTDGGAYRKDVTPIFTGGTATLDGQPYTSGTPITSEGNHTLVITDANGKVTTINFVIDKTPPVISGVTDNVVYKTDVTPTFEEGTATLDGQPYISGTTITSEGSHTLIVTDEYGNTSIVHFIISKTIPGVAGVTNNGMYNKDVTPTFSGGTATLDGEVYTNGTPISSEGNHTIVFTDAAGNITIINFLIDKTAPVINLNGSDEVTIIVHEDYIDEGVTITDNYDGDITAKVVIINPVNKDAAGDYIITYNVTDRSGNAAKEVIRKVRIVQNPSKMELTGAVINQDTGAVVENAKVSLYDFGGNLIAETTTDNSGKYSIKNITLGNYKIVIKNDEYSTKTIDVNITSQGNGEAIIIKDVELVNFVVKLNSNPSSIVGDGVSVTTIEAVVLDKNNEPIPEIEISFSATLGNFINGNKAVTDSNGKATVTYQSEQITGVQSKNIIVKAVVDDNIKNLHSEAEILVTFEPSSIKGIVIDNSTNLPIEGAIVEISKDFDGDGIVDFYAKMITDATGKYTIAVPRGNINYDLKITKPITIGTTTVLKTFKQSAFVGTVIGNGDETFTASNVAAGLVLSKQTDGSIKELTNYTNYSINVIDKETNSTKSISLENSSSSIFQIGDLENGKNYELQLTYDFGNGKKIVVGTTNVSVNNDGQLAISTILIDPYGIITDSATGSVISGANVVLYYANTERNISNGVKPNDVVQLPVIVGFAPNDNKNPQISDVNGEYAFMVFPTTDYYIVVTKNGYKNYVSPTISVEQDIVQHNIEMDKKSISSHSSNDSTVSLTTETFDKNAEKQSDINVTMTLNGNSLISITDGKTTLVNGTDYKVEGSVVTISKNYLAQQSGQSVRLTFNFSAGDSQTFSIALIDTAKDTETDAFNIVMPNKTFELKFNKKLNSETVNLNNVYVSYDKAGLNKVSEVKVQLSEDNKTIKILPAAEGYKFTEKYYLIVTANVTDIEGNKVNSVLYKFTASEIKVWDEEKEISTKDRTFKIIFNKPINSLSVNYNNIFITSDEKGLDKIANIRLRVNPNDSNIIDLIVPKETLIKGHNYYVFVNSDITSMDNEKEGNVWFMKYIVKE